MNIYVGSRPGSQTIFRCSRPLPVAISVDTFCQRVWSPGDVMVRLGSPCRLLSVIRSLMAAARTRLGTPVAVGWLAMEDAPGRLFCASPDPVLGNGRILRVLWLQLPHMPRPRRAVCPRPDRRVMLGRVTTIYAFPRRGGWFLLDDGVARAIACF